MLLLAEVEIAGFPFGRVHNKCRGSFDTGSTEKHISLFGLGISTDLF
jgi:hypothetical protein